MSYRIHAIPETLLERVRAGAVDVSGIPVENMLATGDEPLRCCLRYARAGQAILLFGYEPPIGRSPYREIGAVFACAVRCDGPASDCDYPVDWRGKPQVLRAYDRRGFIRGALVHDGKDPNRHIDGLLANPETIQVHSRNVAYGCFMFVVTRA